ncbi:MAG TPA: 3-hydroxyacyl-CoA dehydrogenase family protein [Solirubrobacteraceae bacterium]|nr:3-hydroxyacyl-CoA dehydrogenase family protein [Solirubrobacteraceae bacterium]
MQERVAIAGSGTIASGLAAVAAGRGEVLVWARSQTSAERAERAVARHCEKVAELNGCAKRVRLVTEIEALADATLLVEAICEESDSKGPLLAQLGAMTGPDAVLATTTSSLSIAELADMSGHPDRLLGLHVFNPVPRMELVELAYAPATRPELRDRARELCAAFGKTPVEVPDTPGFVVNRLLFPYLFDAVALMDRTGMTAEDVDRCMTLGAGMPMGPLALLDFVGLDVSQAIGGTIGVEIPERLRALVAEGALGRKSGRGFHDYA